MVFQLQSKNRVPTPTKLDKNSSKGSITKPVHVVKSPADIEEFKLYGRHVFIGRVANEYLKKYGEAHTLLKNSSWTETHADVVASAVLDW